MKSRSDQWLDYLIYGGPMPTMYQPTSEDEEWLSHVEAGYVGLEKPKVEHTYLTPIEHLQALQGDWPDKDYLPDDSGMHVGDNDTE